MSKFALPSAWFLLAFLNSAASAEILECSDYLATYGPELEIEIGHRIEVGDLRFPIPAYFNVSEFESSDESRKYTTGYSYERDDPELASDSARSELVRAVTSMTFTGGLEPSEEGPYKLISTCRLHDASVQIYSMKGAPREGSPALKLVQLPGDTTVIVYGQRPDVYVSLLMNEN